MSTNSDTPTPRTDKWEYEQECNYEVAWEDNCRQLERELAEAVKKSRAATKGDSDS